MSCGNGSRQIDSFYGTQNTSPKCPLDLIASASLGGVAGSLSNSMNFRDVTWTEINGAIRIDAKPVVTALGTDNLEKVAEAAQWNFWFFRVS